MSEFTRVDDVTPFADLTPERVLDAVEAVGQRADGRLLALNSFENRVYQVGLEDGACVAKFYRPHRWSDAQIAEEHAFTAELAEAEVPVVPPQRIADATLHHAEGYRFALFPRRGGRAPELDAPGVRRQLGRFIGRIHAHGARAAYVHRPALDLDTFGHQPRRFLLDGGFIPDDLRAAWSAVSEQALASAARAYQRAGDVALLRLHGDCHGGNVMWTDAGAHFVDFDDSRTGPAIQDLWMLLPSGTDDPRPALAEVLAGYRDFADFDVRELHLIEALRTLRLIHHSAWLAQRWDDPAFPAAFPWFGTSRYWEERILELREQVAAADEPVDWRL
ncbi:serine/threonine protein kinase [Chitinasiproducens palmae]|uniref:Stress response kinase A n=1 Tax=Chitinasiproducens palmae TaxID=1770053 RepID=A0A1H2PP48_9BURK|nr:serine/threonine protein kinase [Chitinasiproducens palmae]SDV48473.1 Ser/Thr protein kinase RdoA involved in Cpx stress response, MazF antagonist [Chitinasiproducens palmae]